MPQGKRTPDSIRLMIYGMRRRTPPLALDEILAALKRYDIPIGRRTVANIIKEYDEIPDAVKFFDTPWRWECATEYGISTEMAAHILGMNAFMAAYGPFQEIMEWQDADQTVEDSKRFLLKTIRTNELPPTPSMTVRRATWFARTLPATSGLDNHDRFWLNENFVSRERQGDFLGRPFKLDDLNALLAFRPWESQEQYDMYNACVAAGRAEALLPGFFTMQTALDVEQAYGAALKLATLESLPQLENVDMSDLTMRVVYQPDENSKLIPTKGWRRPVDDLSVAALTTHWHSEVLEELFSEAGQFFAAEEIDG